MHQVRFYNTNYTAILCIRLVILRLFTNNAPSVPYCNRAHFSEKRHGTKTSDSQKTVLIIDNSVKEMFLFYLQGKLCAIKYLHIWLKIKTHNVRMT